MCSRWAKWLLPLALLLPAVVACAQGDQATATPTVAAPKVGGEALLADARALALVRQLQLTDQQSQALIALLDGVQQVHSTQDATFDLLWQQNESSLQAVIDAWVAGKRPATEALQAANYTAQQAQTQQGQVEQQVAGCQAGLRAMLMPQQAQRLETLAQFNQRHQNEAALEGAENAPEFIVRRLDAQREMMPDEYTAVRRYLAEQIARALVAPDSPQYGVFLDAVLRMMDTVNAWPDAQYAQQRPTLPQQIAQALNLPLAAPSTIAYYDAVDAVARSPRSSPIIQQTLSAAPGSELPPAWPEHELARMLARSKVLSLLNGLGLDTTQLGMLAPLATQARTEKESSDRALEGMLSKAQPSLAALKATLLADAPVEDSALDPLRQLESDLRQADLESRGEMAGIIDRVQDLLYPAQQKMVDWRVPLEVLGFEDPATRAARDRKRAAVVASVMRFLDGMRTQFEPMFTQVLMGRARELAGVYFPADSPEFNDTVTKLMWAARNTLAYKPQEWPNVEVDYSAQTASDLGLLEQEGPAPGEADRPVNWSQMYDALANPDMTQLIQSMIAARGGSTAH